jgi:hypothetical protein
MPSVSNKQKDFMAAVAHNPKFAKKVGVPQSVGKDFNQADQSRKFSKGGDMKKMNMGGYADGGMAKDKMPAALAKHAGMPASKAHKGLKAGGMAPSKMGGVKTSSARDGIASKGKTKGTMIAMKKGGRAC